MYCCLLPYNHYTIGCLSGQAINYSNCYRTKKREIDIGDHAILRYLERVRKIDIDVVRNEIQTEELKKQIEDCETGLIEINGIGYVVKEGRIVTIIYDGPEDGN